MQGLATDTALTEDPSEAGATGPADHRLVICRHGRPDIDRMVFINSDQYRDWWRAYDRAGLAAGQSAPRRLREALGSCAVVLASTLPRAHETALAAVDGREVATDPVFVEAPLPPPSLPRWLIAQPGFWGVLARITWWLGFSGGGESRVEAEARAVLAVDRLEAESAEHGTVGLVAHGWFNRMMRPVLLSRGWSCVSDGGDTYWSHRVYTRPAPN